MLPRKRSPAHPGKILHEHFLKPNGISQAQFVRHLNGTWTRAKLNEIINEKRGVTVETALDFALALETTPEFWMNLQMNYDLWRAIQVPRDIEPIFPLKEAV